MQIAAMLERAVVQAQQSPARQSPILIELKRRQLDSLPWAIVKVNREGMFTYGNDKLHRLLGVNRIEGRMLADLFHGDDLTLVQEQLESRFTSGASDEYQVEAIRPADGIRIALQCSAIPETDEWGDVIGSIAILRKLPADDAGDFLPA
jgi:PAS domain S-box-containing protein